MVAQSATCESGFSSFAAGRVFSRKVVALAVVMSVFLPASFRARSGSILEISTLFPPVIMATRFQ